jgi:putative phosphoribosyl transferase
MIGHTFQGGHPPLFRDRAEAGRELASHLAHYLGAPDAVVVGLARGGVIVAAELARALRLPVEVLVVKKLGVPENPECALGAVASGGVRVVNEEIAAYVPSAELVIEALTDPALAEVERREALYRAGRDPVSFAGRTVILADDGLATGATMRAAIAAARALGAGRVVVAVPVGAPDACEAMRTEAEELVCLHAPGGFRAVGVYYAEFEQVSDEEVRAVLAGSGG